MSRTGPRTDPGRRNNRRLFMRETFRVRSFHRRPNMPVRTALPVVLFGALFGAGVAFAQQAPAPNPLDTVPDKMPFDVPYGAPISLEKAQAAIAAAVAEAKKRDWKLNVAVVDAGGNV